MVTGIIMILLKASLRAMDAMKEFVDQKLPELGVSLDYFAVSGASKRGWTTWCVGAVDPVRYIFLFSFQFSELFSLNFRSVSVQLFLLFLTPLTLSKWSTTSGGATAAGAGP